MSQDEEHLRLLAIFHYVVGGVMGLFACFPFAYVGFGLFMVFAPEQFNGHSHGTPPPAFIGWLVAAFGLFLAVLGWALVGATIWAGRSLKAHRRRTFCIVVAAFNCCFMPFGTVLGVLTLIVLSRESVQKLFAEADPFSRDDPPAREDEGR